MKVHQVKSYAFTGEVDLIGINEGLTTSVY